MHLKALRGHYIYKAVWTHVVGEVLQVFGEPSNPYDNHAVSVMKDGNLVGHVACAKKQKQRVFFFPGLNFRLTKRGHVQDCS